MRSLGWALERRDGVLPGRAALHLVLLATIVLLQSAEIAGGFRLLAAPLVWAAAPFCWTALGASLGFSVAQARAAHGSRPVAEDAVRLLAPIHGGVVLAAAFALGPIATNGSVRSYLTDGATFGYLLNLIGWPRFFLPGVFEFNDLPGVVNRNVWVVPAAALIVAAACFRPGGRFLRLLPAALAAALALAALLAEALAVPLGPAPNAAQVLFRGDALSVLLGGLLGIAAFRGRRIAPVGGRLTAVCVVLPALLALAGDASWAASAWFRVLCAAPIAHLALVFSLRRTPSPKAARLQPYLPLAFLLTFPLQQLAADRGPPEQNLLVNLALAVLPAALTSVLFVRFVGGRLWRERLHQALTREVAVAAPAAARRRALRIDPVAALVRLAIGAVLLALCFGVMAMMYLAFQSDPGGI